MVGGSWFCFVSFELAFHHPESPTLILSKARCQRGSQGGVGRVFALQVLHAPLVHSCCQAPGWRWRTPCQAEGECAGYLSGRCRRWRTCSKFVECRHVAKGVRDIVAGSHSGVLADLIHSGWPDTTRERKLRINPHWRRRAHVCTGRPAHVREALAGPQGLAAWHARRQLVSEADLLEDLAPVSFLAEPVAANPVAPSPRVALAVAKRKGREHSLEDCFAQRFEPSA